MIISEDKLFNVVGGASGITSSWLNSLARLINTILDIGRSIGSSWNRYKNNNYCS